MKVISIFEDENEEMFARELDEFGSSKESFHFYLSEIDHFSSTLIF